MNLLNKTIFSEKISKEIWKKVPKKFSVYLFFILLHVFLFNINTAEWGDSYRILRASEFIRQGSYPVDEKRPPLFSAVLAVRPQMVDAVTWGRGVMLLFSILALIVFDKLTSVFIKDEKYRLISLLFFILNPVYLYWSIRVMADVPFSFFALLAFYLLSKWKGSLNVWRSILLGFVCGLAVLTRFEGYLLFGSILVGVIFLGKKFSFSLVKPKVLLDSVFHKIKFLVPLGLTTLLVVLPWLVYRNPLASKYFNEPSGRTYDLKILWIYFTSLMYLFGFTSAFYIIFKNSRTVLKFASENVGLSVFLLVESVLILLWPAAIPRLFVSIIPFLVIFFVLAYQEYEKSRDALSVFDLGTLLFLLMFYVVSQYFLKLQFLIVIKPVFAFLVIVQILSIIILKYRKNYFYLILCVVSMFVWSLSTVYIHKNIYMAIKEASLYVLNNFEGRIIYNDTTSVSDWNINYLKPRIGLSGEYRSMQDTRNVSYASLQKDHVSYVILTNEDGIGVKPEIENLGYLKMVKDFRYNIGDTKFFAKVFEFTGGLR